MKNYVVQRVGHSKTADQKVAIGRGAGNDLEFIFEGSKQLGQLLRLTDGSHVLQLADRMVMVDVEKRGDEVWVHYRGQVIKWRIQDERALQLAALSAVQGTDGPMTVCSPMPGKVVRIIAKVGDVVTEGQGLIVVEAMKMENELRSPKSGTVRSVLVAEGAAVENGAKLLVVE